MEPVLDIRDASFEVILWAAPGTGRKARGPREVSDPVVDEAGWTVEEGCESE